MPGAEPGRGADVSPVTAAEAARLLAPLAASDGPVALAVSGGADSLALLSLAAAVLPRARLRVLSVDHGLRPAAAVEAADVVARAASLGITGAVLRWEGGKPRHGLQAAAREARYRLMADWCARNGISALVTAHNEDDQAETFLMRLARGSGVDGLSGMAADSRLPGGGGLRLLRPLLGLPRGRLEATLRAAGLGWHDDPSNTATAFERVRMRHLAGELAAAGISRAALARSALRLARARQALESAASAAFSRIVTLAPEAWARIDRAAFLAEPEEIRLRLIMMLCDRLGGLARPPRLAEAERLADGLAAGTAGRSLGGCRFIAGPRQITVGREAGRIGPGLVLGDGGLWDGRFRLSLGGLAGPVTLTHQGALALAKPSRPQGLPAFVAAALPAMVTQDGRIFVADTPCEAASGPISATARFAAGPALAFRPAGL